MSSPLPSLDDLKLQAKALRQSLAASGHEISHSQSLELLAKQLGYRDWNTLHARTGNTPPIPFHLGQRVTGAYLGKAFEGEIIRLSAVAGNARFGLTIRFDEAVDVIPFENLSNFRRQVNAVVDRSGRTAEKTSNGVPQLTLDMKHARR
jgi:hypothetical protein